MFSTPTPGVGRERRADHHPVAHHQRRQLALLDVLAAPRLDADAPARRRTRRRETRSPGSTEANGVEELRALGLGPPSKLTVRPVARVGLHQARVLDRLEPGAARRPRSAVSRARSSGLRPERPEAVGHGPLGEFERLARGRSRRAGSAAGPGSAPRGCRPSDRGGPGRPVVRRGRPSGAEDNGVRAYSGSWNTASMLCPSGSSTKAPVVAPAVLGPYLPAARGPVLLRTGRPRGRRPPGRGCRPRTRHAPVRRLDMRLEMAKSVRPSGPNSTSPGRASWVRAWPRPSGSRAAS